MKDWQSAIPLKSYVSQLKNSLDMGQQDQLEDLLLNYWVEDGWAIREERIEYARVS